MWGGLCEGELKGFEVRWGEGRRVRRGTGEGGGRVVVVDGAMDGRWKSTIVYCFFSCLLCSIKEQQSLLVHLPLTVDGLPQSSSTYFDADSEEQSLQISSCEFSIPDANTTSFVLSRHPLTAGIKFDGSAASDILTSLWLKLPFFSPHHTSLMRVIMSTTGRQHVSRLNSPSNSMPK